MDKNTEFSGLELDILIELEFSNPFISATLIDQGKSCLKNLNIKWFRFSIQFVKI